MKNSIIALIFSLFIFSACNQNKKAETGSDSLTDVKCYQAISNNDTVTLSIGKKEGRIAGKLAFNFEEKDDTQGTIGGEFNGDTLFVQYDYEFKGKKFSNPQVFLKKGDQLLQGYGSMKIALGRTYFDNHSEIVFGEGFVFNPIDCK